MLKWTQGNSSCMHSLSHSNKRLSHKYYLTFFQLCVLCVCVCVVCLYAACIVRVRACQLETNHHLTGVKWVVSFSWERQKGYSCYSPIKWCFDFSKCTDAFSMHAQRLVVMEKRRETSATPWRWRQQQKSRSLCSLCCLTGHLGIRNL